MNKPSKVHVGDKVRVTSGPMAPTLQGVWVVAERDADPQPSGAMYAIVQRAKGGQRWVVQLDDLALDTGKPS